MVKRLTVILLILVFAFSAQTMVFARGEPAWEIYSEGLELLLDGKKEAARETFENLVQKYPDTEAAAKARDMIAKINSERDHSGIIPFYLGNMLTATYSISSIPLILDTENGIVLGSTGIAGVGAGLYTAWLMSKGRDLTLGHDIWIEFIESASLTNFQLLYNIFSDSITDDEVRGKVNIGGMALTAMGSRTAAYFSVIDSLPSPGRAFTVANAYAWAQYYTWTTMGLILESRNENLNNLMAVIFPDAAAAGAYFLWENLDWSLQRAGLISVSGVGGSLLGIFLNMIITEAFDSSLSDRLKASIVMGFALAGKGAGIYFTRNMDSESIKPGTNKTELYFQPVIGPSSAGFSACIRF